MNKNPSPQDRFHCPLCIYTSSQAGECPLHKVPLLGFSTWVEFKRRREETRIKFLGPVLLVLFVVVTAFVIYHFARESFVSPAVTTPGE